MGAAKTALVIAACTAARLAHADPCTGVTSTGGRFATCFDPGNRLSVTAATDGSSGSFGGSIELRHEIHFEDEPDLVWKLDHDLLDTSYDGFTGRFSGVLYRGRFLRHSRDGHVLLPLGTPKKVFLPFDIGALFEVGNLHWESGAPSTVGVIKTAALIDLSRSRDFRRRLAFGPVASWDVDLAKSSTSVTQHRVAPFSAVLVEAYLESDDGLTTFGARGEAGTAWHTRGGWQPHLAAEAELERIVLAVNDRPIALFAMARYDNDTSERVAGIGLRFVLFDRTDPRVRRL